MGTAIFTVHFQGYGEKWDNTWGIVTNVEPDGPMTADEMEQLADASTPFLTSAGTNPADGGYGGDANIVASILGFHRIVMPDEVTIIGILLNDGTTSGAPTGPFWSVPLLLPCLSETPSATTVAPLSIALLMNRGTAEIGVKPGRLYLRSVLQDSEVYPGSRVGVTWTDPAAQASVVDRMNDGVDAAQLVNFTALGAADQDFYLCIPHYSKVEGEEGQVIGGSILNSIVVNKPVSRQLTRGRRRTPAT